MITQVPVSKTGIVVPILSVESHEHVNPTLESLVVLLELLKLNLIPGPQVVEVVQKVSLPRNKALIAVNLDVLDVEGRLLLEASSDVRGVLGPQGQHSLMSILYHIMHT